MSTATQEDAATEQPDRPRWWRRWGRPVANLLAILALGGGIVYAVLSLEDDPDASACPPPAAVATTTEGGARSASAVRRARADPAVASVSETAKTSFKLGYAINGGLRSIDFIVDRRVPGPRTIPVYVAPFATADGGQQIGAPDIVAWAELQPGRTNGSLYFCIPGDSRLDLPSGQFAGELVLGPGRIERLPVPVTLSVAYPHVATVMLIGLGTALVASWYVFFLRRDQLSDLILYGGPKAVGKDAIALQDDCCSRVFRWPFGFWHGYWRWMCSVSGAITIVAGTTAAVTAFSTVYLSSDTWAGSFRDWFALCGAIASAFVAGGTAGKLTQMKPPDLQRDPDAAEAPGVERSRQGPGGSRPGLPRGGRAGRLRAR